MDAKRRAEEVEALIAEHDRLAVPPEFPQFEDKLDRIRRERSAKTSAMLRALIAEPAVPEQAPTPDEIEAWEAHCERVTGHRNAGIVLIHPDGSTITAEAFIKNWRKTFPALTKFVDCKVVTSPSAGFVVSVTPKPAPNCPFCGSTDDVHDPMCGRAKGADRIAALNAEVIASDDRAARMAQWYDDEVKRAESAEAEIARLKDDAARYRWLRANRNQGRHHPYAMVFDDDLERYIDSAIAAQAGERKT